MAANRSGWILTLSADVAPLQFHSAESGSTVRCVRELYLALNGNGLSATQVGSSDDATVKDYFSFSNLWSAALNNADPFGAIEVFMQLFSHIQKYFPKPEHIL